MGQTLGKNRISNLQTKGTYRFPIERLAFLKKIAMIFHKLLVCPVHFLLMFAKGVGYGCVKINLSARFLWVDLSKIRINCVTKLFSLPIDSFRYD